MIIYSPSLQYPGRHRNASASGSGSGSGPNLTLPSSSTFRRLPTLARSPFRRSEKTSTPPPPVVDITPPTSGHGETVNHRRGSTFPSLSQVVVDDSSVSSAFFASTTEHNHNQSTQTQHQGETSTGSGLLPPSRSSSLLNTPEPNQSLSQQPVSPLTNQYQSPSNLGPSPMINNNSSRTSTPTGNESDLEPITYPSHLAQMKPDSHPSPSPHQPIASTSTSSRTIPRTRDRDFTPPPSSTTQPPELGPIHRSSPSTSNSNGPPFGVPKRKESMAGNSLEDLPNNQSISTPNPNPIDRLKDGETDSGAEETVNTRKRSNTAKPSISGPSSSTSKSRERERDRSLTVPYPASTSNTDGSTVKDRDRDKSRKVSSKTSRQVISPSNNRILEPLLPSNKSIGKAPASSMYYSPVPFHGRPPNQALRAHSGTLVGERIWIIGGVDKSSCWRGVAWFDTESLLWSTIETRGEQFPPLRAHTTTLVGDKLFIFGGGDGPSYSNEVWVLDTVTHRFSRPTIGTPKTPIPPPRRAHTTVLYKNYLIVFGGGNGQAALNDVWALDITDLNNLSWQEWKTKGDIPQKKGYHTANLVGDKMIVFGGSDGHASFADIHILNLQTRVWTLITTDVKHNRLSHTSTQVGSYLFIIGGHNGQTYAQDVLLFNLVTLQWETKSPKGVIPPGRGYHVALLHDARIFISGGYNGESVFDDLWTLDLSAGAYLPQVTTFEVDETAEQARRMLELNHI
ncbi:hypothetical protein I302_103386 [Kwoniella bestiolae CBS 10118]|uniref:Kelch repeat-containing protein n=1 Tax=Kwoniella bestiolae CBS 10118 TaxID=1296100 RepID=A0A1B9G886_9TREE|nr:kelch repeat-containing protein [Kwoniella bestiolae CBS 10118]OCF27247.1 kelch repeat-containing protein [Kwoniella bestiolae CBS 10118]